MLFDFPLFGELRPREPQNLNLHVLKYAGTQNIEFRAIFGENKVVLEKLPLLGELSCFRHSPVMRLEIAHLENIIKIRK